MNMLRYLPEISLGLELVQDPAFQLEFFSKYLAARCPRAHGSLHSVCIWNPVFSSMVPEKRLRLAPRAGWERTRVPAYLLTPSPLADVCRELCGERGCRTRIYKERGLFDTHE